MQITIQQKNKTGAQWQIYLPIPPDPLKMLILKQDDARLPIPSFFSSSSSILLSPFSSCEHKVVFKIFSKSFITTNPRFIVWVSGWSLNDGELKSVITRISKYPGFKCCTNSDTIILFTSNIYTPLFNFRWEPRIRKNRQNIITRFQYNIIRFQSNTFTRKKASFEGRRTCFWRKKKV